MAKVPYVVETLRKISIAWVGCTNVTDRRQTDGRRHIANVRSLKPTLITDGYRWRSCTSKTTKIHRFVKFVYIMYYFITAVLAAFYWARSRKLRSIFAIILTAKIRGGGGANVRLIVSSSAQDPTSVYTPCSEKSIYFTIYFSEFLDTFYETFSEYL